MKNKKSNKTFIIIIILIILVGAIVGFLILNKDNKLINTIFNNNNKQDQDKKINDNENGVYVYKKELGKSYNIYNGCSVSTLDQYIIILKDEYYVYDSTCLGTFFVKSGEKKELDIEENPLSKTYVVTYEDKVYKKDLTAYEFTQNNKTRSKINKTISLDSFNLIVHQTQFQGEYYQINSMITNSAGIYLRLNPLGEGNFQLILSDKIGKHTYYSNVININSLPKLSTYTTSSIIVLEKDRTADKYSNRLKLVSTDGTIYNSDNLFPITIQGVELNTNNSIFIKYDQKISKYRVLIGNDTKYCREDDSSDDIVNYEFTISYDYSTRSFTDLKFVKIGRAKDGCDHVKSILEENIW